MHRFKPKQAIMFLILLLGLLPGFPAVRGEAPQNQLSPAKIERLTIQSSALGKAMRVAVCLPPGYDAAQKYPVLYLIHGFNKDEYFIEESGFVKKASEMIAGGQIKPVIIVAPQIDNSYGVNSAEQYQEVRGTDGSIWALGRYEDYLIQEVIPAIDRQYPVITSRDGRYIGGFSMGGYVSLRLGFFHTGLFSKVGGHMPAVYPPPLVTRQLNRTPESRIKHDIFMVAQQNDLSNTRIYLDCGRDDSEWIVQGVKDLYRVLQQKGVEVRYSLGEGGHNNAYFRANMADYFLFYAGKK